jgi:hypothetical protein
VEDILFQTPLSSCLIVVYTRGRVSFKSGDGELSCFKNKNRFLRRQKEREKEKNTKWSKKREKKDQVVAIKKKRKRKAPQ